MKHWVFDLDGTLVDSWSAYERTMETILGILGHDCKREDLDLLHRYFSAFEYFRLFFNDESKVREGIDLLLRMNQEQVPHIVAFDGVFDLLAGLSTKNVMISVWTGRDLPSATRILEHTGLSKFVGLCVSGSCVAQTKPHPEGLLKILSSSKMRGDDVVMVGDHEYDMMGAKAAGVLGVGVSWKAPRPQRLAELSDRYFEAIGDLQGWAFGLYPSSVPLAVPLSTGRRHT